MKTQKEIDPNLPVNKSSKYVVSKANERYSNFNPGDMLTNSIGLPVKNIPSHVNDLTGIKKGRLTVVGLSASFSKNNGRGYRWVVKCSCGRFEIRTARTILRGSRFDMCNVCKSTAFKQQTSNKLLK